MISRSVSRKSPKKAPKKMAKKTKQAMASRSRKQKTESAYIKPLKWAAVSLTVLAMVGVSGWYVWNQKALPEPTQPAEQMMPIRLVEIQGELKQLP